MRGARGMVITVEIKHHQLWGFSTFHSVPLSLSPSKAPSSLAPTQTALAATPSGLQPLPPSLLPSLFFPTIFHPAPLFYLYLPFYPPIYFPLIFSTSLHPLLYLSSLCFPRLSQRAHLYLIPRPKCASLPILCAPPRAHLHTNMHASRRSHKWPHNTNDPHRCMSGM